MTPSCFSRGGADDTSVCPPRGAVKGVMNTGVSVVNGPNPEEQDNTPKPRCFPSGLGHFLPQMAPDYGERAPIFFFCDTSSVLAFFFTGSVQKLHHTGNVLNRGAMGQYLAKTPQIRARCDVQLL